MTQPFDSSLTRRALLGTAAAGAAALASRASAADLPARGNYVVRHAHVLTMDDAWGDFPSGDIHIRNGEIVMIATELTASGAQSIEGRGMIALPGLIDTHNHLWNTTCRNIVREGPEKGYFPTVLALGKQYTPEDTYRGVRLGCAELLSSGVTTVHDW